MKLDFTLNGESVSVEAPPYASLLSVLRDRLSVRSTKQGCDYGGCGACTVLIDGKARYSCMTSALRVKRKSVTTLEGLAKNGVLDPLQQAFNEKWAAQCGFCSAGMILSAKALLDETKYPSESEIREAIVGNLCVCTGYQKIVEAIQSASINSPKTSK
ncbi:MAG TPA: (2Fe-2S)-binding protein [Nitrososphaerales archaeon]|nr:(2Fe-2S)-binding protein [Nitrososphaerales archaeon]